MYSAKHTLGMEGTLGIGQEKGVFFFFLNRNQNQFRLAQEIRGVYWYT